MDETKVREHAEAHGRAMVAKEWERAGSDVVAEIEDTVPGVMKRMPRPIEGAEVVSVEDLGDSAVAVIVYSGADQETKVESTWADREGRPMIVKLEVL